MDGESAVRLNLVAVWREATVFTEAERAALELTEQGTRLADAAGGVTDEAWANAAKHYDDDQLAALVSLIGRIPLARLAPDLQGCLGDLGVVPHHLDGFGHGTELPDHAFAQPGGELRLRNA